MTHKFVAHVAPGEAYVVRFYPESRSQVVEYEPDLVRRCAQAGAKVPQVVADSRTGPAANLTYMVYKMIEGSALSERFSMLTQSDLRRLCADVMECLTALQQVKLAGWGEVVSGWKAASSSWREFVRDSFSEGLEAVRKNRLLPEPLLRDVVKIGDSADKFLVGESNHLIYGDIGLSNIVLDGNDGLAGLIDFEGALAGDPLLTLGYCHAACARHSFFDEFSACWRELRGEIDWGRVHFYSVLRTLRVAKYASEPLPTGHPRDPLLRIFPGFQLAVASVMNNDLLVRSHAYE